MTHNLRKSILNGTIRFVEDVRSLEVSDDVKIAMLLKEHNGLIEYLKQHLTYFRATFRITTKVVGSVTLGPNGVGEVAANGVPMQTVGILYKRKIRIVEEGLKEYGVIVCYDFNQI